MNEQPTPRSPRSTWTVTIVLAVLILVPSLVGFVMKFVELVNVASSDGEGLFALTPIVNYLLASLGFLCLLVWAAYHGMFHDIERPKYDMLALQQRLDEEEGQ